MNVKITDIDGRKPSFVQWDVDRVLYISGCDSQPCLHFSNIVLKRAIVVEAEADGSRWVCRVPNFILQYAEPMLVSVFVQPDEGKTVLMTWFAVTPKMKPQDYTYEENIGYVNWVEKSEEAQELLDNIDDLRQEIQSAATTATSASEAAVAAAEDIDETVAAALQAAKVSGDFDGADGRDGQDGAPGPRGDAGEDGVSPRFSSTAITGGHRITVQDAYGEYTFDVMDGVPGRPGEPGAPGAPGDDYILTDEDRAEIARDTAEIVLEPTTASGNPLAITNGVGGTRPLSLLCEVEAAEAVTLTRTGKNIWDSARFLEADGWTLEEDGSFSGYNSELYYSFGRSGKSMFGNTAWNEQVTVSFDLRKSESSTAENTIEIVLNYADGTKTSRQNRGSSTWQHCSVSSTIGKTIASIQFSYGSKAKIWLKNFQVEFNGADTGYQPYAATVYQLPIPDAPASGTIDLTEAARDAVTMLEGANVVFADCTSLTMTYPVRPAGSGGNVQSVNGKTGEVVLSASDVHALPDTTEIPSRTSQLQNDSGYLTQHQDISGKLDKEQGAANAGKIMKVNSAGQVAPEDNRFVVTLTPTAQDFSGVMDKTCAEITAAYEAGKDIWLEIDATAMGYDLWRVKATIEAKVSGENYGQVMGFLINLQLTPPSMIFIFTEFNTSGDENRYTTQIYPLATGQWTGGSY